VWWEWFSVSLVNPGWETWPRSGTMQNGMCWARTTSAPRIGENGFGYWLPTPTVSDAAQGEIVEKGEQIHVGKSGNLRRIAKTGQDYGLGLARTVKHWPTPTVADSFTDGMKSTQQKPGSMHSVNLSQAVRMFPTPKCSDASHGKHSRGKFNLGEDISGENNGGRLNPNWVEWLMGWPIGWTDLQPLAMDKFQEWQQQHSPFSETGLSNDTDNNS